MTRLEQFQTYLDTAVPLAIIAILERGGISKSDFDNIFIWESALELYSEQAIFGGEHAPKAVKAISDALAFLSFCPGGVTLFGRTFDSETYRKAGGTIRSESTAERERSTGGGKASEACSQFQGEGRNSEGASRA